MEINQNYYESLEKYINSVEQKWRKKELTSKKANNLLVEKRGEINYHLKHNLTQAKIINLLKSLNKLISEIEAELESVYVVIIDDSKIIPCADETIAQKCVYRLRDEKKSETLKLKVCETTSDLDDVFEKENIMNQTNNI